jgi:uncharacterized protein YecT (DUF1311 family)
MGVFHCATVHRFLQCAALLAPPRGSWAGGARRRWLLFAAIASAPRTTVFVEGIAWGAMGVPLKAYLPSTDGRSVTARTHRAVVGLGSATRVAVDAAMRPGFRASRFDDLTDDHMMRPLRVSIAIAASVAMLGACDDGTRAEAAASHTRESSLARDLELAGDSSLARRMEGRDTTSVTESPGMLESTARAESTTTGTPTARNAANVSSPSEASAEGYIGPSCASPARDDQQRCLLGYLAKSDVLLDRYYQALIVRLKSEAGTSGKAAEPASVQRLRTAQRAWLVYRDDECRKRTVDREGPLWAPVRAQCLAEYSALRARELEDALAKRKSVQSREQSSKSKRPTPRKTTRRRSSRGR